MTVRDLLLFTLREAIIAAAQFNYVFWQLTRHLGGCSFLVLIRSIQPKVHLLEHLMYAEAVLKDKHLLQGCHGKRWNTLSTSWKGLRCAERAQRFKRGAEQLKEDRLWHDFDPVGEDE